MQSTPDSAGGLTFFLLLDAMLSLLGVSEDLVELGEFTFSVITSLFATAADFSVAELVIRVVDL